MSDALCRLKANLPHQYLPDLFEVIKEYDYDIDRHMKTIHKKDDHLRTADKEIASLRAELARLQAWHDAVMAQALHSLAAVPYAYSPGFVPPEHAMTVKTVELIIRPQPLAKE